MEVCSCSLLIKWRYLPCSFINFVKTIHPARLLGPARLTYFSRFPSCSLIKPCSAIRQARVIGRMKCIIALGVINQRYLANENSFANFGAAKKRVDLHPIIQSSPHFKRVIGLNLCNVKSFKFHPIIQSSTHFKRVIGLNMCNVKRFWGSSNYPILYSLLKGFRFEPVSCERF